MSLMHDNKHKKKCSIKDIKQVSNECVAYKICKHGHHNTRGNIAVQDFMYFVRYRVELGVHWGQSSVIKT